MTGPGRPIDVAQLKELYLFEGLTDEQLEDLVAPAVEVAFEPGAVLFTEGEPATSWWVLLEGELDLQRNLGREDTMVTRMALPGRWSGGFRAWDEHGVYLASARAATAGRVLQLDSEHLRAWTQRWFSIGVHLIEGLFGTARSIESTARERAALVTLGTLSAGLAHELNNPATAAVRAVSSLGEATETLLRALRHLANRDITAAEFTVLDTFRQELGEVAPRLSPLAMADREEELLAWLDAQGVARAELVGPALAAGGADVEWCERVRLTLPDPALGPALEWVAASVTTRSLLAEVAEATGRISSLVSAVKSYSQMDRASQQRTDVRDGMESTLVMLGHMLRDGVVVERDYAADTPEINAYPGELNQVWTNLISNAVDAMQGHGTIGIATRRDEDGDGVVVEVRDSGPGMPTEVLRRAFDPFFTTKDVGKGPASGSTSLDALSCSGTAVTSLSSHSPDAPSSASGFRRGRLPESVRHSHRAHVAQGPGANGVSQGQNRALRATRVLAFLVVGCGEDPRCRPGPDLARLGPAA